MKNYTTNKRYCPHEITTKKYAVELYRSTKDISFVCRRYKVSKASLMRWNKRYDGTRESLEPMQVALQIQEEPEVSEVNTTDLRQRIEQTL